LHQFLLPLCTINFCQPVVCFYSVRFQLNGLLQRRDRVIIVCLQRV
jgi:hypothetical protein